MAIPKVCGIETEFRFITLDKNGKPIHPIEQANIHYRGLEAFTHGFLSSVKAILHGRSQETPLTGIEEAKRWDGALDAEDDHPGDPFKLTAQDKKHRLRVRSLSSECDGFLPNGARFYLDVEAPEYSTPECLLPLDLVAHDKAGELAMLEARQIFQFWARESKYFSDALIYKSNSDGFGHSWGSHLNVLLSRETVIGQNFFYFARHYMPFQIARMVLIGGGKVGAEYKRPDCEFQISQRADFFDRKVGLGTTDSRPILNIRDEPHADRLKYFRLHDISPDSSMCETALFLKVALTQIVLAMIEDRFLSENWFPSKPVLAAHAVSRDLKFETLIPLQSGKRATGLETLRYYLAKSREYLNQNPMSDQHVWAVKLAEELLDQLEKDPFLTCGKLDWTTTWMIAQKHPELAKKNVLGFRDISEGGLYARLDRAGKIHHLLDKALIVKAQTTAPINTRAHLRGRLMKELGDKIGLADWSLMETRGWDGFSWGYLDLGMPLLDERYYAELLSKLDS
ncbi:MAG: proteasome accessory factor PafA2 family protein [bacterium]|nr:proteasome accessory factor PafA2 family protein [bacterium]